MPCGVTFRLNPERASRTRNSKPMAGCPQAIICANPEKNCFFFFWWQLRQNKQQRIQEMHEAKAN